MAISGTSVYGIDPSGSVLRLILDSDFKLIRTALVATGVAQGGFGSAIAVQSKSVLTVFEKEKNASGFFNSFALTDLQLRPNRR